MDKLKAKAKALEPIIRVGKAGLTEQIIKEMVRQLKKRKLIKIKMLKSFIKGKDKKEVAKSIAELTESELVDQIGFVVVLYRK